MPYKKEEITAEGSELPSQNWLEMYQMSLESDRIRVANQNSFTIVSLKKPFINTLESACSAICGAILQQHFDTICPRRRKFSKPC